MFHSKRLCMLVFSTLITACSSMMGPDSIFYDDSDAGSTVASTGLMSDGSNMNVNNASGGGKPRPYAITPQDEANYQDLSSSIDQRVKQLNDANIIKNSQAPSSDFGTSTTSNSSTEMNVDSSRRNPLR